MSESSLLQFGHCGRKLFCKQVVHRNIVDPNYSFIYACVTSIVHTQPFHRIFHLTKPTGGALRPVWITSAITEPEPIPKPVSYTHLTLPTIYSV